MTSPVDRQASIPVYGQIADDLEALIGAEYAPGEQLPSVAELAARYAVNRLTVHEALDILVRRGLVTTVKGKGSFANGPIIRWEVRPGDDASLTGAMLRRGHRVENRLLDAREDDDPDAVADLGATGTLLRLEMARFVDAEPWSLSFTWLDPLRLPGVTEAWTPGSSLHALLAERYDVRMKRARRTFAALAANPTEAALLAVPVASPILRVRGVNVDQEGRPVAVVDHRFRGDRIQFSMEQS